MKTGNSCPIQTQWVSSLAAVVALCLSIGWVIVGAGACSGFGESDDIQDDVPADRVSLRRFPPPFAAILAISNHIDGITVEEFREIHRFLNTREEISMGTGLRLDFANSFESSDGVYQAAG